MIKTTKKRRQRIGLIAILSMFVALLLPLAATAMPSGFSDNGASTRHFATGLEWLDLSVTANRSFASVTSEINSQIGLGAEDWRLATDSELQTMLSGFFGIAYSGGAFSGPPFDTNSSPLVNEFIAIFGDTFQNDLMTPGGTNSFGVTALATSSGYANGFYASAVGADNRVQARFVFDFEITNLGGTLVDGRDAINGHRVDASTPFSDLGAWLVRPISVSEPTSVMLFIGALLLFLQDRRFWRKQIT